MTMKTNAIDADSYTGSANSLFRNFDWTKIKIDKRYWIGKKYHTKKIKKATIAYGLLMRCIVYDIFENDVTFSFPKSRHGRISLVMADVDGDEFKSIFKSKYYKGLDPFKCNFHAFRLVARVARGDGVTFDRKIYYQNELRDKMIKRLNDGKTYSGAGGEKTLIDYIDQVHELIPLIEKGSLYKLLNSALIRFQKMFIFGVDFKIISSKSEVFDKYFRLLFSNYTDDTYRHMNNYKKKAARYLRYHWIEDDEKSDGYWYFALTEEFAKMFEEGTPMDVLLYKMKKECIVDGLGAKRMYKIPESTPSDKFTEYRRGVEFDDCMYVGDFPVNTFKELTEYFYNEKKKYIIT